MLYHNEVLVDVVIMFLCSKPLSELTGKRVVMFSYGSGLASCMYSLRISPSPLLNKMVENLINLPKTLAARRTIPPADFERTMKLREETHHLAPYQPVGDPAQLFPGTYYLTAVDERHRRSYARVPQQPTGIDKTVQLKSPLAQSLANGTA